MTYGVQLPDGRIIGFDDSVPKDEARLMVRRDYPDAFKQKEGLGAEFSEGLSSLLGSTKTALTAPFNKKEVAKRALLEDKAREAEFKSNVGLDKLQKAYEDYGITGGIGEILRQAPYAIAGQAPQIMATLGATATGARLGSSLGPYGALGGGIAGFASSFLPQSGQFITRQAEEQQKLGEEINPNLLKAYGYAVPAAAIDVATEFFGLGKGVVSKVLGTSEKQLAAKVATNATKAEADLVKAAQASLAKTVGKGAARGLIEIPGEMAQQILERANAGLDLFSDEAFKEYGAAGYQAALIGPAMGGAAGPIERSSARTQLEGLREQQRAKEKQQQAAEEQQYKASPEYVDDLLARRAKALEEMDLLKPIISEKVAQDDVEGIARRKEARARMRDLRNDMQDIIAELREVAPETKGLPETLDQRIWRERIAKQTKPIGAEREMVTDEFGNIVPGLTKKAALAGRELSAKDRATADSAMQALRRLKEAEAKRQLTEAEKARKEELENNIEAINSSERLWRDLGLAHEVLKESQVKGEGQTTERAYVSPPSFDLFGNYIKPEDITEPGVIRSKGLEQVLNSSGKQITPEKRVELEKKIDSGQLDRSVKGFFGLSGKTELGERLHDLTIPEDAQEALPVIEERIEQLRRAKQALASKDMVSVNGAPTQHMSQAIANEVAYGELTRLANIAKDTLKKNKGAGAVDAALTREAINKPTLNLIDKNLAPEAYEKIIHESLAKQQEHFDSIRITLDDLADQTYLGGKNSKFASATKENLQERANKYKEEYINEAIKQAEAYRAAKGLPGLTQSEMAHTASQMHEVLDEAITRGQLNEDEFANVQQQSSKPIYEDITVPAQMRAGKIATPAYTYRKLVGYEGLSDEAKARQAGEGEQKGFTSRAAAMGSIGLDYGPKLPANLVKQMRAAGLDTKNQSTPSQQLVRGASTNIPGVVEHRGYVQDKLAELKVGLMQRPKQAGEGTRARVPSTEEKLFLTKTEEKAPANREDRVLADATEMVRKLRSERGEKAREIHDTLDRALEFVTSTLKKHGIIAKTKIDPSGFVSIAYTEDGKEITNPFEAPKETKTEEAKNKAFEMAQAGKVIDLMEEQVDRLNRGQDKTARFSSETQQDLNKLLDSYEEAPEGQAGLFTTANKQAQRQLEKLKERKAKLNSKDLGDLKELLDLKKNIEETESWLKEFSGPSGMGRAQLISMLRRPANDELLAKIKKDKEAMAAALESAEKENDGLDERRKILAELNYWTDYLSDLRSLYKYAYLPKQPVDPRIAGNIYATENWVVPQNQIDAYNALKAAYEVQAAAPYEGDVSPLSQEDRKAEYYELRKNAVEKVKELRGLLKTTRVVETADSIRQSILKDAQAELEEIYKTRFAHHAAVLESIKNAPERYEHYLKVRSAAEAQLAYYEAVETSGALPGETATIAAELEAAKKEAKKLFMYADNTAKSIEAELNKDLVIKEVAKDPQVKRLLKQITSLQQKIRDGKDWAKTDLTEAGKEARDARALAAKENQEIVKAGNEAQVKIAKLNKQYTVTKVAAKDLDIITKERAVAKAIDYAQNKVDSIEIEIKKLEIQSAANLAGKVTKDIQAQIDELNSTIATHNEVAKKVGLPTLEESGKPFEIAYTAKTNKPAALNAQQRKGLDGRYAKLEKAKVQLETEKRVAQQIGTIVKGKAKTTIGIPEKSEAEQTAERKEAYRAALDLLETKRKEIQQQIYDSNKAKAPQATIKVLENRKQTIKDMEARLERLGPDGLRGLDLDKIMSNQSLAEDLRIRRELRAELDATKNVSETLQQREDYAKVLEERANIAEKQGNKDIAKDLRDEAKEIRSELSAERVLLAKGNNPEKVIHKHALRTGHNSFLKTAREAALDEFKRAVNLTEADKEAYVRERTRRIYNKMVDDFYGHGESNDDVEGTAFRDKAGAAGGIDLAEADSLINKMLAKERFSPMRRTINAGIAAAALPIKIPNIKDVNADFKKMLAYQAFGSWAMTDSAKAKYDAFEKSFIEKHGSLYPDDMGDLSYETRGFVEGIENLMFNLAESPKIRGSGDLNTQIDNTNKFLDIFASKRNKLAAEMFNSINGTKHSLSDINEFLSLEADEGGPIDPTDYQIGAYLESPIEYVSNVTEGYLAALKHFGLDPKDFSPKKAIESSEAKKVQLATGASFVYAKTFGEAPAEFQRAVAAAGKDPNTVRGGVLPDGTIVVIGANHTSVADLEDTIAHETIGHYAVDTLLGPKGMKNLVSKVFAGGEEQAFQLATDLGVYDDVLEAKAAAISQGMTKDEMQMLMTREMIAHVAEPSRKRTVTQAIKDFVKTLVAAVRKFFADSGLDTQAKLSTQDIYNLIRDAKKAYQSGRARVYTSPDGNTAFFAPTTYGSGVEQDSINTFNKLFAKNKTMVDTIKANATGLARQVQWFDHLAAWEHLLNTAEQKGMIDSLKALESNYYLRTHGQRLNLTAETASYGVSELKTNEFGETEFVRGKNKANLANVAKILEKAKALGSPETINRFFQTYLTAKRVQRVGIRALSADLNVTKGELDRVVQNVERIPGVKEIFDEAAKEYASYNKDLLNLLVKAGYMSKELAANLTRYNDYVPFYRVRDGIAELAVVGEHAIMLGRIKENPYLHELIGSKDQIVDFETSAFQNTALIVDLATQNLAKVHLMQSMEKVGVDPKNRIATRVRPNSKGTDIVHAKVNGQDAAWRINTKDTGFDDIPSELLVKSLEGIKTTIPLAIKLMGIPTRWLRHMITRTPTYGVNQIVKDSTAMWLYSGADIKPVWSTLKELGSMYTHTNKYEAELQGTGFLGGQLFTGMPEDMKRAMLQIQSGKGGFAKLFANADKLAIKADAATRVAMYRSYLDKGMSPMRAKLATLEALNFNKRGLSPSMHMLSTVIPFMNTQVQGLNVLAKAFNGTLTLGQQKDLRKKMFRRGMMLGAMTLMYAAAMHDDEAYKKADPVTKYNSWFVRLPFFEEPIKIPAPFEFGYVFKALPEAVYNLMFNDEKAANVLKFAKQAAINSTPFGVPQAFKPLIEASLGKSFYTDQPIESQHEKQLLAGARFRPQTTEAAKALGRIAPETISPVMVEHLARGYGGALTIALASVLNPFLSPTSDVASPQKTPSQYPLIGGFFQPNDGPGIINAAYETANRIKQVNATLKETAAGADKEKAKALINKYAKEIAMDQAAGAFVREMGELSQAEKLIRASNKGEVEKTEMLKKIRAMRQQLAENFQKINDRE